MRDYTASTYGERVADVYDGWMSGTDSSSAVATLAGLARGGPVLELGVGTGRLACPLARRGLQVYGIDASPAMLAKLRMNDPDRLVEPVLGDMADVAIDKRFSLVFAAANSFFGVLTQDEQSRCFANVAAQLTNDGVFVLDAFLPAQLQGSGFSVTSVELDSVRLQVSEHDPVAQTISGQSIELAADRTQLRPFKVRYAWPSELDLMARLAGLQLRERWGDWDGRPFTGLSSRHVSVYARGSVA